LGREVVPRLVAAGHDVRLFSRQDRPSRPDGVEAVRGDVSTGDGVDRAMAGVDTLVHCATSPFRRVRRTEIDGTRRLIAAAENARCSHVVYMSIVGVDRNPLPYYKAKHAAERLVAAGNVPYSILRATQFHSLLDGFLSTMARLPVLPTPRGLRFQPVATDEVAARLAALVDGGGPQGRADDMGGPEVRAFDDLARAWMQARGRTKRLVHLPLVGRTGRAFRAGVNLCPEQAGGTCTWEEWLAASRDAS
jgi:uncharacterized protein YbjT (DUF2867 family)